MCRRRTYLRVLAAGAAGLVAGCSDDGGGPNTDTTTGGTTETVRTTATTTAASSQRAKFVPDDSNDWFGESVALSGDGSTAIVGAPFDEDPNGEHGGSAYVFVGSGGSWGKQSKLASDGGDSNDQFGASVALSDDGSTAVVGADRAAGPDGDTTGATYVLERSGGSWSQTAKLVAGDDGDRFGESVAVSGDGSTAVVGAHEDGDPNGFTAGSAYVFEGSDGSWSQQAKLVADDGDSSDFFGKSVAVSADGATAVVGAYRDEDPNGEDAGSAYVFEASGGSWTQQAKIAPDDGGSGGNFGEHVAVSSDGLTAFISGGGAVYVFEGSGGSWGQQAKLAPDDDDVREFGKSAAVTSDGSTAVISGGGAVYVFGMPDGSWSQQARFTDDPDVSGWFGYSVAVTDDGSTALVSVKDTLADDGKKSDAAYVLDLQSQS